MQSDAGVCGEFAQALTAQAVLDLCEDGARGDLAVEQGPGLVDYERTDREGATTRVARGVTGPHPHTVLSGDVWDALRRWCERGAAEAVHVLETDGTVYPSAVTAVVNRLWRFARRAETAEDRIVVEAAGVDAGSEILRRVRLRTGFGRSDAVVADVAWRVERLVGGPGADEAREKARAATRRLLSYCDLVARGEARLALSEASAFALLGIDRGSADHHPSPWTADRASRYRSAVLAGGAPDACRAPSVRLATTGPEPPPDPAPVVSVLDLPGGAVVVRAAGDASDGVLAALSHAAAERGRVPVTIEPSHLLTGSLETAVRRAVEAAAGWPLSAGGARQVLRSPDVVLLLECADDDSQPGSVGHSLVAAAADARAHCPSLTIIAVCAAATAAGDLGLPTFSLHTASHAAEG